ncbi:MAG: molybdopterin-dependent oxidoreductase [Phycisphaerae bacterium]|nr:molybdopterin-dependent oxidoreductase [Phycisphaerae bacterium]
MTDSISTKRVEPESSKRSVPPSREFTISRRTFVQTLGAGILITVTDALSWGQRRGGRGGGGGGGGAMPVVARLHLNEDGTISVMSGKVEEGQGARTELSQAAAEELRVPFDRIRIVMADTDFVPDDGGTSGSRTTPGNVPPMRQAAATARELLTRFAAKQWQADVNSLEVRDGTITNKATNQKLTYADLAKSREIAEAFKQPIESNITLTAVSDWKVMGSSVPRANNRDLVTGAHQFPSDVARPNMFYGRVLRPPSYKATLESIDLSEAKAMKDAVVVHEGEFVGFAAPSLFRATQALEAAAKTASWKVASQPSVSHKTIHSYLQEHARMDNARGVVTEKGLAEAAKTLSATYTLAYIQHTPMETRAGVAEWKDDKLTVWAGVDNPPAAQRDLAQMFGMPVERVRVIVPDMGGGFGGKHAAPAAQEAARLAKVAGRPVCVHWTRAEEFTWAYFRPAAVIECKGGLDAKGSLIAWDFININAGGSAIDAPYNIPNKRTQSVGSDSPLAQGAYRCLAATGNNFARESFIDELAAAAGADPLEFRLTHLDNPRIRTVLETVAQRFNWSERKRKVTPELGVGLACGTEKNSVVAACVEVGIDRKKGEIKVREVCQAFECGPILNPANLTSQVQGCIVMGLGGALFEEIEFENGKVLNADFGGYRVPRFRDVPKIDVVLVNKTDIPSAGGGETPIIAVAPAVGNAVFAATGVRIRSLPMRGDVLKRA